MMTVAVTALFHYIDTIEADTLPVDIDNTRMRDVANGER